jgi:hypothetical protein
MFLVAVWPWSVAPPPLLAAGCSIGFCNEDATMKVVIWKAVEDVRPATLATAIEQGFQWYMPGVCGVGKCPPAAAAAPVKVKAKVKKRRRKTPLPWTPKLAQEMADLRKTGLVWRLVGKRYGVSSVRAYQIVRQGVQRKVVAK